MRFTDEHRQFRASLRDLIGREINPRIDEWEAAGAFPAHEVCKALAGIGAIGLEYDPSVGGQGADASFSLVLGEELGGIDANGVAMAISVQTDMATPAIARFGSPELQQRYLAPACRGEQVAAIAVTEADAGSDVAALRTRAERDGDEWVLNGSKLYITNGAQADWLCLLARTSDEGGHRGMSQLVVPTDLDGVVVSRTLHKLGNRCSDTAELSFTDVRVPVANTIGEVGRGFQQQMAQFQNERMIATAIAWGQMRRALDRTADYLRERRAFGAPLLANAHLQHELARLAAEVEALRQVNHACAEAAVAGGDTTRLATVAKALAGPLARRVADTCLQFHGGVGYMEETWTARYYRDARLLSIGGGADEVMLRTLARIDGYWME